MSKAMKSMYFFSPIRYVVIGALLLSSVVSVCEQATDKTPSSIIRKTRAFASKEANILRSGLRCTTKRIRNKKLSQNEMDTFSAFKKRAFASTLLLGAVGGSTTFLTMGTQLIKLKKKHRVLEDKISSSQSENKETNMSEQQIVELQAFIDQIKTDYIYLQKNNEVTSHTNLDLNKKLNSLEETTTKEKQQLESDIANLQAKITNLNQVKPDVVESKNLINSAQQTDLDNSKKEELQASFKQITTDYENLKKDRETISNTKQELEKSLNSLEVEMQNLKANIAEPKKLINNAQQTDLYESEKEDPKTGLLDENQKLFERLEIFETEINKLTRANEDLQKELNTPNPESASNDKIGANIPPAAAPPPPPPPSKPLTTQPKALVINKKEGDNQETQATPTFQPSDILKVKLRPVSEEAKKKQEEAKKKQEKKSPRKPTAQAIFKAKANLRESTVSVKESGSDFEKNLRNDPNIQRQIQQIRDNPPEPSPSDLIDEDNHDFEENPQSDINSSPPSNTAKEATLTLKQKIAKANKDLNQLNFSQPK